VRRRRSTPSVAPIPAETASPEAWKAASRKTDVSIPSRTTAKNATDRDRGDHRLEALLLGLGKLVVKDLEPDCDPGAEPHGEADAGPHPAHRVGPGPAASGRRR
jgi:hypothetical protein